MFSFLLLKNVLAYGYRIVPDEPTKTNPNPIKSNELEYLGGFAADKKLTPNALIVDPAKFTINAIIEIKGAVL